MNKNAKATAEVEALESESTESTDLGQLLAASVGNEGVRSEGQISGVVVGELVNLTEGVPNVIFAENPSKEPLPARSTVRLSEEHVGSQLVLMFERGHAQRPIVVGVLQPSGTSAAQPESLPWEANVDKERLVLSAKQEIELRCGKASIILTKAGKILLRGAYVLSRSSGANRIKGASVQIN